MYIILKLIVNTMLKIWGLYSMTNYLYEILSVMMDHGEWKKLSTLSRARALRK